MCQIAENNQAFSVLDDAITIEEIASITGRNEVTLRQWARLGILPGKRLSKRIYIASRSLFLQSITVGSLADRFSAREVAQIRQKLEPHLSPKEVKEV